MYKPQLRAQPLDLGAGVWILAPPLNSRVTLDRELQQSVPTRVAYRIEGVELSLRCLDLSAHQDHLEGWPVKSGMEPGHLHFPKFPGDAAAACLGTELRELQTGKQLKQCLTLKCYIAFIAFALFLCECYVAQSRPSLCDPMDCSSPGSSVHEILQARRVEWIAMPFSTGSSRPRDGTRISCVSCIGRQILYC